MPILPDVHIRGTRAQQPLPKDVSAAALYYVTDEGVTERSNGSDAWESYSGGGGGGGSVAAAYPIGSIYMNTSDPSDPAVILGFGTWASLGAGRVLVGFDATQTEFNASGKTGGAKTHLLTTAEMPAHTHIQDPHTHIQNPHSHPYGTFAARAESAVCMTPTGSAGNLTATATNQNTTAVNNPTGGSTPHNNLPPYLVVYMWTRTA